MHSAIVLFAPPFLGRESCQNLFYAYCMCRRWVLGQVGGMGFGFGERWTGHTRHRRTDSHSTRCLGLDKMFVVLGTGTRSSMLS